MTDLFLERDAVISDCGKYRYLLRRTWDHGKPRCLYVMLNPSTADAEIDDATIRSCIRLAKTYGYGSFEVVNLMAWRATDPKDLPAKPSEAMGSDNPRIIEAAIARCDVVICAWGAHPYAARFKGAVLDMVGLYRPTAYCLGKTKAGAPKHPLYIKSGTPLEAFR
ncbi:hypothetical protein SAMN05444159_1319 [Bradyrhizobium lablabi]|uniref:DUF1643 domain-containing protein n=1 Tax=Bradyrhizobium lablabi TaxID=722472 RepID=A0A1M6LLT0_9BRAD|nr:DUF1643 domain-containing protein [Bradyrhizobium lablabi]SHJ72221.1 hypothetical protein SAMN05444159_1319 [Bradyrhizobium lablabi]